MIGGSTTAQIAIKTDKAGKVYFVVLSDGAYVQSATEVKAGTGQGSIIANLMAITRQTGVEGGIFKNMEAMISMMINFTVQLCIIWLGDGDIQGLKADSTVKEICPDT